MIEQGRKDFADGRWRDAFDALSAADRDGDLEPADLELLATAAFLVGEDEASADAWSRAHHGYLAATDEPRAARCAFWLGFGFINRGQFAQAMGWFGRAQRILDEGGHDCAERGYLLIPRGIPLIDSDPATASELFVDAAAIGRRFDEPDLVAMGTVGRGRALFRLGHVADGLALLDEVMVTLTSGKHSAMVVGNMYCVVLEGCFEILDVRRATEWTGVLTEWCDAQPGLVPYRGQCLVLRAAIMQMRGEWAEALEEAKRARERLAEHPMVGDAHYVTAEIHRLRGEGPQAEEAYKSASAAGRDPQPGLALLRLAEGRTDLAEAALRRALEGPSEPVTRARHLAAYVEIMLARDDVASARAAADELSELVATRGTPFLRAVASDATGAVLLAEGDLGSALAALESARRDWSELDCPYEAARARVEMARVCGALGDDDAAAMELDAARRTFETLGAARDLNALTGGASRPGGLTERELEVIRLVASGKTNRAIAAELVLSEKTVARHVSNIFTKLGLSSRAAATAYAYEHDLV